MEDRRRSDVCSQSVISQNSGTRQPREGLISFVKATSKAAQSIIRKELDDITKPVLDDMSAHKMLQSETSQDLKAVADDITQSIVEKTEFGRDRRCKSKSKTQTEEQTESNGQQDKNLGCKESCQSKHLSHGNKAEGTTPPGHQCQSIQLLQSLIMLTLLQIEDVKSDGENELAMIPLLNKNFQWQIPGSHKGTEFCPLQSHHKWNHPQGYPRITNLLEQ